MSFLTYWHIGIHLLLQIISVMQIGMIAKKVIYTMMFIISYHDGIKCLRNLLQLEPCNVIFKVISDIVVRC